MRAALSVNAANVSAERDTNAMLTDLLEKAEAERDALHAEAEALRAALLGIASVNPAQRGIEWAKSYASDGLKGAGSELYARWLDTFKEAEALRADNEKWRRNYRDIHEPALRDAHAYIQELRTELEAARGLLRESRKSYTEAIHWEDQQPVMKKIDAFLTAFPVPEVRCQTCDGTGDVHRSDGEWLGECHCVKTEQGERQEPVAWSLRLPDGRTTLEKTYPKWAEGEGDGYAIQPLYTTPQPGPDVRALAASLYQSCGAYDMPERILDALSAAANGEPFAHMIDGLLPCVPPSGQDARALVEALENCAAALAWNCFGECRAIHAGPIMPAAVALEMARTALATYRQDT